MKNILLPALFILFGVTLRLLPHPANFAPITGMALFGGAYLNKRYALLVPIVTLFLSDIFLGFHQSMIFVYGSVLLSGCMGLWLREHKSVGTVFLASLVSSVLFFLITNFGFWLAYDIYPKTFLGQVDAYVMALPFFRNTLLGDLFYTSFFFGSFELMKSFFLKRNTLYGR